MSLNFRFAPEYFGSQDPLLDGNCLLLHASLKLNQMIYILETWYEQYPGFYSNLDLELVDGLQKKLNLPRYKMHKL